LRAEKDNVDQHTVLIVSDDASFSRQVSARWLAERSVPAFTVLGGNLDGDFDGNAFELAILGPVRPDALKSVPRLLESSRKPFILVCDARQDTVGPTISRMPVLRMHEGWPDALVLLAAETLRRVDAVNRAERADLLNARLRCHATLGQYVIEMRHTMNNALTSVLGNSELLLLEPGAFSAGVRAQVDTIRNMALRLHEILQRFSSLEKELAFVEKQAVMTKNQTAAVGS